MDLVILGSAEPKRSPPSGVFPGVQARSRPRCSRYPDPMFTGIVEELGTVLMSEPSHSVWGPGIRLRIAASTVLDGSDVGASIAVNGCCLTLVSSSVPSKNPGESWWETDVSSETLDRTTIGALQPGDRVNLERPMALGDRLGGHIVLGHVDGVGEVVSPAPDLVVRVPQALMRYLVEKGSVTVDGISLTAFDITQDTFRVAVIPHTAEVTTLGHRPAGSRVNLEMDVLAKHIERLVEPYGSPR
jgi:riboflavin synthase